MSSKPLLTALLAVLAAGPALAQDTTAGARPADNMQILRDKLRADKKLVVAGALELTEAEARVFWPVYESYQSDLGAIGNRTIKLIQDYAASYDSMTAPTARNLVDASVAIERDRVALMQSYLPRFRQVLSDIKVARYYQVENKIRAAVNYELAAQIPLAK